ncbi:hypothetical protein M9H77_01423 [Catharanthus roseus]|uniref:Uncharacterized protein n=2 Tax=Catharanthus roseus TaxID=4058 RepID=A0ACC0C5I3_CATRO|nr:hypothetical protein M9H77_01421 [Catharanthus roseus]KAI5680196.1 hypothetical protein M9H77_01423 [Catharanthus roseus]
MGFWVNLSRLWPGPALDIFCFIVPLKSCWNRRRNSSIIDARPAPSVETQSSSVHRIENEVSSAENKEPVCDLMVGWTVYKKIGMYEEEGTLVSYNSVTKIYEVEYKNGKSEKVTAENVVKYLSPCRPGDEQPSGRALRMRAMNAGAARPARKPAKRKSVATAPSQQSRKVPRGSATSEKPPAASGSGRKEPYKSLRTLKVWTRSHLEFLLKEDAKMQDSYGMILHLDSVLLVVTIVFGFSQCLGI